MSHDLLSSIGSRIERLLNAKHTHTRSIEDEVRARVSENPPAVFKMMPDDAATSEQLPLTNAPVLTAPDAPITFGAGTLTPEISPSSADISAAIAPFAAILSSPAQILTDTTVSATGPTPATNLPDATPMSAIDDAATSAAVAPPESRPSFMSLIYAAAGFTPVVPHTATATPTAATTSTETTAAVASGASPAAMSSAESSVATPAVSANIASFTAADASSADSTSSVGREIYGNVVPNLTPAVPAEYGIGAMVRRKGILSDTPLTVTQSYNGLIRATSTDSRGTHTYEFQYNQFDLLTPAPV